jgi:hypothetical protein
MNNHSADDNGLYWQRTETSPSWLAPIICPFSGSPEVQPGSLAEKVVESTPEFKDAHKACLAYLKSGPDYQQNAALHREAGTLDQYHATLEESARDYATRTVANDTWRCGGVVYPYQEGSASLSMPIKDRIAQAAQPAAGRATSPAQHAEAGAPWRRAQEIAHEPESEAPSRSIDHA